MNFEIENSFERCKRLREKLDARYAPAPGPTIESVKADLEAAQKTLVALEAQAVIARQIPAQDAIDQPPNYAGIRADAAAQSPESPLDPNAIFNDEIRRLGRAAIL
jgi:hypothetical protein